MAHPLLKENAELGKDAVVEAFISNHSTFTIQCPRCLRSEAVSVGRLPSRHPNPLQCECPCGAAFRLRLVGFRAAPRKAVNLAASFRRVCESPPNDRRFCAVVDLSVKGLRFTTERMKTLLPGEDLKLSVVLDDAKRTKLELPAIVRRVVRSKTQVTVGVEFHPVRPQILNLLQRDTV